MNANDVMKDLSRKHKRFPKAALTAAVTMRSDVAPLMLKELKRLLAAFDASLDAPTEKEHNAKRKEAVNRPLRSSTGSSWRPSGSRGRPSGPLPSSSVGEKRCSRTCSLRRL